MKIVVDSNILCTYFWQKFVFSQLCRKAELTLYSPEYALEEINKYNKEILKKNRNK